MSAQVRGTFPQAYDGVSPKFVTALLGKELREHPKIWDKAYRRKKSKKKFERFLTVTPFGDVPEKGEGERYASDFIRPGWQKDITPVEFGLAFVGTETSFEDDEIDVLAMKTKLMAFVARVTQEKYAARPFNNGFTTHLTPDGLSLFNTAHLLKGGGTFKNRPSSDADLGAASLEQALVDVQTDTKLESGQLTSMVTSWILWVHPSNYLTACKLVDSQQDPESAMNAVNPLKTKYRITVMVNPYFSDSDAWFLEAADVETTGMVAVERIPIVQAPVRIDPWTENEIYKVRFRIAFDTFAAQNIYGTAGA